VTQPLSDVRILEVGGVGPGPYGVLLLAGLGAEVIRVDRPTAPSALDELQSGLLGNRRSVCLDLKAATAQQILLELVSTVDVLVEGFRPGVAERLGFGPDVCLERNPRLVYARMTGWGQEGPLQHRAGHDINYAALSGALHPIGPGDRPPTQPLNYMADFGGGGTFLAIGVLAALQERSRTGLGQVVDVAMLDGTVSLTAFLHGMRNSGIWPGGRGDHPNDGSRPYYGVYETADGGYVAVGCIEPEFYAELLERLDLPPEEWPQDDPSQWPVQRERLEAIFRSRTRAHWEALFATSDACVTPVLSPDEAPQHPQLVARGSFVIGAEGPQPAPPLRFSRSEAVPPTPVPIPGTHTREVLTELGRSPAELARLEASGAIR
jgi:alpha-methylacyl-CoA racemase